jgi:Arc/MetJ-type ribon-helix-helix transcriptional regulator
LDEDKRRPTWSVNVELPAEVGRELAEYEKENEFAAWTLLIHEALYVYRWQFRTREELDAELRAAIEEGESSEEAEGAIEVTPDVWKNLRKTCERDAKRIHELTADGKLGNLLLPLELHAFIIERMESGECRTPTDVVCAAMPHLRKEREREAAERREAEQ